MANRLIAAAAGNFTSASTWQVCDTTMYSNSNGSNLTLSTSFSGFTTGYTPGAITIDGIAVKMYSRVASPTGTMTVQLFQGATPQAAAIATVNVSDLPTCNSTDQNGGWVFLKFASPFTLTAATAYNVQAKCSVASEVILWRNNGAQLDLSIMARTTTTAAPGAGDTLVITNELTGTGTKNQITVTMDSTSATDYGPATTGSTGIVTPALSICNGGILTCGTTASTNYILQLNGFLSIFSGGTLNWGTSGTPIPPSSTATLQFNNAANGSFGIWNYTGGTLNWYGSPRTSGKLTWLCKLNANAAANATTLNVDTDTGWLSGDSIVVASTSRTTTDTEKGTLNGAAGSSSLTVNGFAGTGGGLAVAHSGTSPAQGEIFLLTRNTVLKGVSSSFGAAFNFATGSTTHMEWIEMTNIGVGAAPFNTNACFCLNVTTGSFSIQYFSAHDLANLLNSNALFNPTVNNWNNITIQYGVGYNFNSGIMFSHTTTTGSNWTIDNVWAVTMNSGGAKFNFTNFNGTISNLGVVSSVGNGNPFSLAPTNPTPITGTVSNLMAHSNLVSSSGPTIYMSNFNGLINGITSWRNNLDGITINDTTAQYSNVRTVVQNLVAFGNTTMGVNCIAGPLWLINPTLNGDTSFSTTIGIRMTNYYSWCQVDGGSIGVASGILTTHTTADIGFNGGANLAPIIANNVNFGSATTLTLADQRNIYALGGLYSTRHNQIAGNDKTWLRAGILSSDSTTFYTAAPSENMAPNIATTGEKMNSSPVLVAVDSGASKNVSVYVYKSAAYNGSQPRLILKANAAVGVTNDTVLATMTVGTGTWQQLTGSTPAATDAGAFQFYVDCDGTAGAVNVDDWSTTWWL